MIAIASHVGFVNRGTESLSQYLLMVPQGLALHGVQPQAGRGLGGNIIWPMEHMGFSKCYLELNVKS